MAKRQSESVVITIKEPNFKILPVTIEGISPYMQAKFSSKTRRQMMEKMKAGSTARGKKERAARDFDADFEEAQHISSDGWVGIPAPALRNAAIDVCRMVGFKMTHAKMSVFVMADGFDKDDGTPLIKLIAGEPEKSVLPVRNATGVADLRARPMWRNWSANIRIRYDADQFTAEDVFNLIKRAGLQVGIGEGRPYSKSSNGMDMGMFDVKLTEL